MDQLPGTSSPINLSKPNTIPTITLTNRQQLFSKTANTTPHINMLYSNRRRSHEPTNCIKISTDTKTNKQTVSSLFLTNACHILNKIDELSSVAEINDPDLICISESWLDSSISDGIISIGSNYIPYRKDRGTPGGGLITYVKTAIPSSRLFDMEEEGKEALWLLLKSKTPKAFQLHCYGCSLLPPRSTGYK